MILVGFDLFKLIPCLCICYLIVYHFAIKKSILYQTTKVRRYFLSQKGNWGKTGWRLFCCKAVLDQLTGFILMLCNGVTISAEQFAELIWFCILLKTFSFIVCLTTGPQLFPKRVLCRVRSIASSFSFQDPRLYLWSSSSFLHLLLVFRHFIPSLYLSFHNFRRQFLCKMLPIQLASLLLVVCRIFLSSLTLCNTSSFLT